RLGGAALERAAERSHPFPGGVRGAAAPLRCGIRCHRATARAGGWYQPLLRPPPQRAVFPNEQVLDFEGLAGRVMSASYAPTPERPEHGPLMAGLREVFERHQRAGRIVFPYQTLVFFGQPDRPA